MKILHIIDSLGLGGAQSVVRGIFEYENNDEIFLYSLRNVRIPTKISHQNIHTANSFSKYSFTPLLAIRKLIKEEGITAIHCHLFRSNVFGVLLKLLFFPKIKLIIHEHGGIQLEGFIYAIVLKLFQGKVDVFIAVSDAIKRKLIEADINTEKIKVLYNFVDLNKFSRERVKWDVKEERSKHGIPVDSFVIGFAGRLVETKGWRVFLEMVKSISAKNSSLFFIIAGDGADKKEMLCTIEKSGLSNKVLYMGRVENMPQYYSLIDCLTMPSYIEPMGIVELEAMAMAVPVVASDVDGLNEVVKNGVNGLLFEVKNSQQLSEKVELLINDETLRAKMIERAKKDVDNYGIDKYIDRLNIVYS